MFLLSPGSLQVGCFERARLPNLCHSVMVGTRFSDLRRKGAVEHGVH